MIDGAKVGRVVGPNVGAAVGATASVDHDCVAVRRVVGHAAVVAHPHRLLRRLLEVLLEEPVVAALMAALERQVGTLFTFVVSCVFWSVQAGARVGE